MELILRYAAVFGVRKPAASKLAWRAEAAVWRLSQNYPEGVNITKPRVGALFANPGRGYNNKIHPERIVLELYGNTTLSGLVHTCNQSPGLAAKSATNPGLWDATPSALTQQ
jgi:hypothetical protein